MDNIPNSVKKVEKAMESMIAEIQKAHLLPKQKEAFLCCAKCCDSSDDLQQLQGWWVDAIRWLSDAPACAASHMVHLPCMEKRHHVELPRKSLSSNMTFWLACMQC